MKPIQIDVSSDSRAYQVHIGEGLLDNLGVLLDAAGASKNRFLVSSPTVWKSHGQLIEKTVTSNQLTLIPDGERSKTTMTVGKVYEALIQASADRTATIVAIGGGVIGDMVGFAAATFLRGVQLVQVPTTLLAQVDSSIGGKVGVNHTLGKNLIGAFHSPIVVVADPLVLTTLPRREFRAGLYEVIKYGMIADRDLFDRVERELSEIFDRSPLALVPIIAASCRIKAEVVSKDEREKGLRRILNFGHTAGHAIEAITKYRRFRHGEAVGYGMLAVSDIAVRRGIFSASERQSLAALIGKLGPLPSVRDLSAKVVVDAMRRDKKMLHGKLHVVLPTRIGKTTTVTDVSQQEFIRSLKSIGMLS